MSALREQQAAFVRAVFQGEAEALAEQVVANGLSGQRRLQVYRNNIYFGLRDALAAVYPVLQRLVGEDFFQQLATGYLQAFPSRSGNLHDFGEHLPGYLADCHELRELAYLPDVARLEWAYHQVFHAAASAALDVNHLAAVAPADYERLRFRLAPASRYLSSPFPILRIWETNQAGYQGGEQVCLDDGACHLVVARTGLEVAMHPLGRGAYELLRSLRNGMTFVAACDEVLSVEPDCDVGATLQYAVQHGLVTGFTLL
jgi:hypothetical protein